MPMFLSFTPAPCVYLYIARLRVDHKYLVPSISLGTKLDYLIPTTTGAGVCTTSLVDFLVCTHNDFMEKCREQGYGNLCAHVC